MTDEPKNLSGVRIPPPVLTLIHLIVAFLFGWLIPLPLPVPNWVSRLGGGIAVIGLVLAFWAFILFSRARTTLNTDGGTTALVNSGPYRFTRNPIYVALVCLLAGFPLVINDYWGLILSPVLIVLMNKLVIEYEEKYLAQQLGQPYLDYKARVRRWL